MLQKQIKLQPIQENFRGELADSILYECAFCHKYVPAAGQDRRILEKLSGERMLCTFCLQNRFHHNSHILKLSFRSVIGWYYQNLYLQKKIYFRQLEDLIDKHTKTGLKNPTFRYDPETYLWFVDFDRIGGNIRNISVNFVLETIVDITACFEIEKYVSKITSDKFVQKFQQAIEKFNRQRIRPEDKQLLVPSLQSDSDHLKNFTRKQFIFKNS